MASYYSSSCYCRYPVSCQYCGQQCVEVTELPKQVVDIKTPPVLSKEIKGLYAKGILTDVEVVCEEQTFQCHKAMLACASPVFQAMFENKDTKEARSGQVRIKGMSPATCGNLIAFFYAGVVPEADATLDLLVASDMYDVKQLKLQCEQVLKGKISSQNAAHYLLVAAKVNAEQLMTHAAQFVKSQSGQILRSEEWKDISARDPQLLIGIMEQMFFEPQPKAG